MPYIRQNPGFRQMGQGLGMLTFALLNRRQQATEREKKALEEQSKVGKDALKLAEDEYGKESPQASYYRQALLNVLTGHPPDPARLQFGAPPPVAEGAVEAQRARQMGWPTPAEKAQQQTLELARARATGTAAGKPPKGPSASSISAARREMEKYQETIATATERIGAMRKDWNLGVEGVPKTPKGYGRKKEQERLDEWNKWNKMLTTAQDSLARIQQWAKEKGVTLKFGAEALPGPGEVLGMSENEVLQGIWPK